MLFWDIQLTKNITDLDGGLVPTVPSYEPMIARDIYASHALCEWILLSHAYVDKVEADIFTTDTYVKYTNTISYI